MRQEFIQKENKIAEESYEINKKLESENKDLLEYIETLKQD